MGKYATGSAEYYLFQLCPYYGCCIQPVDTVPLPASLGARVSFARGELPGVSWSALETPRTMWPGTHYRSGHTCWQREEVKEEGAANDAAYYLIFTPATVMAFVHKSDAEQRCGGGRPGSKRGCRKRGGVKPSLAHERPARASSSRSSRWNWTRWRRPDSALSSSRHGAQWFAGLWRRTACP